MAKEFNDTGLCIPHRHYMVDNSAKLEQIITLIDKGSYFTINRPRQFGKTTTLFLLSNELNRRADYIALKLSFEGIDSESYQHQERFISEFLIMMARRLKFLDYPHLSQFVEDQRPASTTLPDLSRLISQLIEKLPNQAWVLMIDEVDKSSNNQLFLDFLAMLRNKYLHRDEGEATFQSVILAGVHDIKTLKRKLRPDEVASYNSPWNIAVDFKVDLSFSPPEIETMLQEYAQDKQVEMDQPAIAQRLYYYTSGYPYLVSKLCKFIDEEIIPARPFDSAQGQSEQNWSVADVEAAFKLIVDAGYTTTLFDSLSKNLENNPDLYEYVFQIVVNGTKYSFVINNPVVNLGYLYGILVPSEQGRCRIHNRIFEQRIYDYMLSKFLHSEQGQINGFGGPEFYKDGELDVPLILRRFQAFMKEHYSHKDAKFLEREGRLLFLAYLKPIVNGRGFEFKEPAVADERRMDIVITYRNQRYVIELKRWYGEKYHQAGLQQLSDYLDSYGLKQGYLLIYDFNKGKTYKEERIQFQDKSILAVWV